MEISVSFTEIPIPPQPALSIPEHTGALVEFRGLVRPLENERPISALRYEAYLPMAQRTMEQILQQLASSLPCLHATVIHRVGIVPVGEAAIYVGITATHRAEAFELLSQFMLTLKRDVPIWKVEALP